MPQYMPHKTHLSWHKPHCPDQPECIPPDRRTAPPGSCAHGSKLCVPPDSLGDSCTHSALNIRVYVKHLDCFDEWTNSFVNHKEKLFWKMISLSKNVLKYVSFTFNRTHQKQFFALELFGNQISAKPWWQRLYHQFCLDDSSSKTFGHISGTFFELFRISYTLAMRHAYGALPRKTVTLWPMFEDYMY